MVERTAQLLKLRAACALLIFLIIGPMAQLATAATTSVDCSMACCIEDGFCCCNPHDEDDHASADSPGIEGAELVRQCPNDCAAPGQIFKLQSRDSLRAACYVAVPDGAQVFRLDHNIAPARTDGSARSAPRAPPALLATSSIA